MLLFRLVSILLVLCYGGISASLLTSAVYAEEEAEELPEEGKLKISFSPFFISIMNRGKVRGTADVQIVLQLQDNGDYEEVSGLKPQLRADISAALSNLARQRWGINRPIDPDIVSTYLKPFIDYRIGKDRVEIYVVRALINPR